MDRAQKHQEVDTLQASFAKAELVLCADYRGLTVEQVTNLRKSLRTAGASARVVKNKLAKIAVKREDAFKTEAERFLQVFHGPTMVVFSDVDPIAPTKALTEFAKKNAKLEIKGAWVDGRFVDPAGVEALSKMPGKQELLGQLLSLFNAPATRLVGLLQAPAAQVVRLLEAQRKNLEEKGGSAA